MAKDKREPAREFFYHEKGRRADAALHQEILDEGDVETAKDVSRARARKRGVSEAQIERLYPK